MPTTTPKPHKNPTGKHAFAHLKRTVIDQDLCVHCGLCVGVCPESCISMSDKLALNLPVQTGVCKPCSLCSDVCPGADVNFPALNEMVFGQQPETELGNYESAYVGYAKRQEIRQKSTAGGVVTTLVAAALNSGFADGAIVVGRSEDNPAWEPEVHFIRSEAELRKSSKSTYTLIPVLEGVSAALQQAQRLIIVALPCQVQAIRKWQSVNPEIKNRIVAVIGLYCGVQLYFDATRSLLKRFGIESQQDYDALKRVDYRAGEWPGRFEVEKLDGEIHTVSKAGFNFLAPFYAIPRCWQCIDPSAELADISVGDGWLKEGKDTQGTSVVVARTATGSQLLALAEERLTLEPVSGEDTIEMHSHTFSLKKTGSFIRLMIQQGKRPTPHYHLTFPAVGRMRYAFEWLEDQGFRFCSSPLGRQLIEKMPLSFLDWFFTTLRTVWQKLSKNKKGRVYSSSSLGSKNLEVAT